MGTVRVTVEFPDHLSDQAIRIGHIVDAGVRRPGAVATVEHIKHGAETDWPAWTRALVADLHDLCESFSLREHVDSDPAELVELLRRALDEHEQRAAQSVRIVNQDPAAIDAGTLSTRHIAPDSTIIAEDGREWSKGPDGGWSVRLPIAEPGDTETWQPSDEHPFTPSPMPVDEVTMVVNVLHSTGLPIAMCHDLVRILGVDRTTELGRQGLDLDLTSRVPPTRPDTDPAVLS